jgi:hypothetical protein
MPTESRGGSNDLRRSPVLLSKPEEFRCKTKFPCEISQAVPSTCLEPLTVSPSHRTTLVSSPQGGAATSANQQPQALAGTSCGRAGQKLIHDLREQMKDPLLVAAIIFS